MQPRPFGASDWHTSGLLRKANAGWVHVNAFGVLLTLPLNVGYARHRATNLLRNSKIIIALAFSTVTATIHSSLR